MDVPWWVEVYVCCVIGICIGMGTVVMLLCKCCGDDLALRAKRSSGLTWMDPEDVSGAYGCVIGACGLGISKVTFGSRNSATGGTIVSLGTEDDAPDCC
jgi:hypothetical protein